MRHKYHFLCVFSNIRFNSIQFSFKFAYLKTQPRITNHFFESSMWKKGSQCCFSVNTIIVYLYKVELLKLRYTSEGGGENLQSYLCCLGKPCMFWLVIHFVYNLFLKNKLHSLYSPYKLNKTTIYTLRILLTCWAYSYRAIKEAHLFNAE